MKLELITGSSIIAGWLIWVGYIMYTRNPEEFLFLVNMFCKIIGIVIIPGIGLGLMFIGGIEKFTKRCVE